MSGEKAPMSERFAAVASLVGRYGYQVRHQTGSDNGNDWEITFHLGCELGDYKALTHHCAAPSEDALLEWLSRWLPEQASKDWRAYAITLEADIIRRNR